MFHPPGLSKVYIFANCSVIPLVVALKPLHNLYNVKRIVVSTYQSVSGAGKDPMDELLSQTQEFFQNKKLKILIQVNLDNDVNKGGIKKEEVVSFKQEVQKLSNLDFNGIMIMPSVNADDGELKFIYEEAWKLAKEICEPSEKKCELSMGMTHDFKIAVEAGSSMVRIGTGIFGERE